MNAPEGFLVVNSNGPEVVATNFFSTQQGQAGFCYLSINAGCFRLLVPPARETEVEAALRTTKYVIVTQLHRQPSSGIAMELLFEDNSDRPFVILLDLHSVDRWVSDRRREGLQFIAYKVHLQRLGTMEARFRKAARLPSLAAWQ